MPGSDSDLSHQAWQLRRAGLTEDCCCTAVMSVNFFRDSLRELRLKQGSMSSAMLYVYQVCCHGPHTRTPRHMQVCVLTATFRACSALLHLCITSDCTAPDFGGPGSSQSRNAAYHKLRQAGCCY